MGPEAAGPACLAQLVASGARAEAATAPAPTGEGCGIASPIRLSSVTVAGGDVVSLPDRPILECEFAAVLADYIQLIVAPLGEALLRAKVASIETGPGYDCRTQDRVVGAKISAHAKGLAVDLVAIAFADKRRLLVERPTGADEAAYFRAVRTAACGWFTTVLGPGADTFPRQQHAHGHREARLERELPHLRIAHAYCAIPLPNDQFSFLTSTRLTKTSSGRRPSLPASPSAIAL